MQIRTRNSPIGEIILAADGGALTGLWFKGQKYECADLEPDGSESDESEVLDKVSRWLEVYFAGGVPERDFELSPSGSEFRQRVWRELLRIPRGETVSYGELAKRVCCESPRAIGNAVGHNPISVIIPCHRVVGANAKLTGYAGGVDKKAFLLELEKRTSEQKGTEL